MQGTDSPVVRRSVTGYWYQSTSKLPAYADLWIEFVNQRVNRHNHNDLRAAIAREMIAWSLA